jgi:hypothetical protein
VSTKHGIPSNEEFWEKYVQLLPQASHVREEDAAGWLDSVRENDPTRFEWHYNRLFGLGGSDIGEVTAWRLGVPNLYKTPGDIVASKLLRIGVQSSNPITRRGSYLEPVIQRIFCEDYNATSRTDLKKMVEAQRDPAHPWMRGNLDDLVEVNGHVYIVDYKSPGQVPSKSPLQYVGQLVQYGYLFEQCFGVRPSGLIVCYFDNSTGLTVPKEVPGTSLVTEEEIRTGVLEGGDEVWNHVLSGTFPDPKAYTSEKTVLPYTSEEKARIEATEGNLVTYKSIADAAYAQSVRIADDLETLLRRGEDISLKGVDLPLLSMTPMVRQTLDQQMATTVLQNAGQDLDEFCTKGGKFDKDKVFGFCAERNIKPPIKESFSVSLRATRKVDKAVLTLVKDEAARVVDGAAHILDERMELIGDDELQCAIRH